MPRVYPSQVRQVLRGLFYEGREPTERDALSTIINRSHAGKLAALMDLVDQIPSEHLVLDADDYIRFTVARSVLRDALQQWQSGGRLESLDGRRGYQGKHELVSLYDSLLRCPDQAPAAGTQSLEFVTDAGLRENLRLDISAANSASSNGEWKAATVLAGSVVEALLLWSLQQQERKDSACVSAAVTQARAGGHLHQQPNADLLRWHLPDYIEVAACLGVIRSDTRDALRLTRDFRNLIHPGRVQRLQQNCDRGTALLAIGAMELTIRDLR